MTALAEEPGYLGPGFKGDGWFSGLLGKARDFIHLQA